MTTTNSLSFRVTLLESSIIFVLLSVGYQGAILVGRKWSSGLTFPTRQNSNVDIFDIFEPPLFAERIRRKEQLLQQFVSTSPLAHDQNAILAEALLHPALLAHPDPRHIVILTNSTFENRSHSYIDQAFRHKSVEKVRILQMDKSRQTWASNVTFQNDPAINKNFRMPARNGTNSNGIPRNLEDNGNGEGEIPVSLLFVDSTVALSPAELAAFIHNQQKIFPFSLQFTMIVELVNRAVIPDWVDALSNWDSMSDVTIRLPLPPPSRKQLRNYLVVYQDSHSEAFWHRNEAEWNRKLLDTLVDTRESFVLDSTLMSKFEYPSKHSEVEFCRRHFEHNLCQSGGSGFDPLKPHLPVDLLDVQRSQQGEHSGRGVFATVDIAAKTYIGIEAAPLRLSWTSTHLILQFTEGDNDIHEWAHDDLEAYFDGYGVVRETWGMMQYDVDATKLTFVNHGCNGSNNVGDVSPYHESNLQIPNLDDENELSLWIKIPEEYLAAERDDQLYFPIRNPGDVTSTESKNFIAAGQEILDNYLTFAGTDGRQFWIYVGLLQQECSGVAGFIEEWEARYREDKQHVQQNLTAPLAPSCERQYACLFDY